LIEIFHKQEGDALETQKKKKQPVETYSFIFCIEFAKVIGKRVKIELRKNNFL